MNGNKQGFTLIETVIALAVFAMVMLAVISIFMAAIQSQRRGYALQDIQENARYALEMMAKEIRMAEINNSAGVSSSLDITAHKPEGDKNVVYSLNNGQIIRNEAGGLNQAITSTKVEVTDLQFYVEKDVQLQPRVTVAIQIKGKGGQVEAQPQINLQTTIVSRTY